MNDNNDNRHTEECGVCDGYVAEGEEREAIADDGEIIAYIHRNCPSQP